jgi:hypothetical protein
MPATNILSSSLLSKNIKIKTMEIITFPVLYGCETRSFALRKDHRLRVFEKRVLRKIFGPKREAVTEGQRKIYNGKLHEL